MRGLRILLLGRPRLELDGQPLTRLIALKHQALVYYLAVQGGPVSRAQLATLLWETLDEAAARANLRVALTRLRRWLPELLDIDDRAGRLCRRRAAGHRPGRAAAPHWTPRRRAKRAWPPRAPGAVPLLDGLALDDSEGFERWLAAARQRAQRDAVALRHALAAARPTPPAAATRPWCTCGRCWRSTTPTSPPTWR